MAATGVSPGRAVIDPMQAVEEFRNAILEAGLILDGPPIMDGEIHRVPVEGAKSLKTNKSGGYIGHLDERPAGTIWNYKEQTQTPWSASKPTRALSDAERRERDERSRVDRERREAERVSAQDGVARWAQRKWDRASEPGGEAHYIHPYCLSKRVSDEWCRTDENNTLLVPMYDVGGQLWNVQQIAPDGAKHFTKNGRIHGLSCPVGEIGDGPILFAEGYATAATLHEATGHRVVACFTAGNLKPTMEAYRQAHPDRALVIAADNDHHLPTQNKPNTGIAKAMEAAAAVNAYAVLVPSFSPDSKGTDWNDYHAEHGIDAVRDLIDQQLGKGKDISMERTLADVSEQTAAHNGLPDAKTMVFDHKASFGIGDRIVIQEPRFEGEEWKNYLFPAVVTEKQASETGYRYSLDVSRTDTGGFPMNPPEWRVTPADARIHGRFKAQYDLLSTRANERDYRQAEREHFIAGLEALADDNQAGIDGNAAIETREPTPEEMIENVRENAMDRVFAVDPSGRAQQGLVAAFAEITREFPGLDPAEAWDQAADRIVLDAGRHKASASRPNANPEMHSVDIARNVAIERVNSLPVDSGRSQRLLGDFYRTLTTANPALDTVDAWQQAAAKTVEFVTAEAARGDVMHEQNADRATTTPEPLRQKLTRSDVERHLVNGVHLKDKDMTGLDLSGLRFINQDLSGSILANVTARDAVFQDSFALGADFTGAQFDNCTFSDFNAAGSCWVKSQAHGTSFDHVKMDAAILHDMVVSAEPRAQQQSTERMRPSDSASTGIAPPPGRALDTTGVPPPPRGRPNIPGLAESLGQDAASLKNVIARGLMAAGSIPDNVFSKFERWMTKDLPENNQQTAKRIVEFAHNTFVGADLTGIQIIGMNVHHNTFDGAILRGAVGLDSSASIGVIQQLERDSKLSAQISALREEGLRRIGANDPGVSRELVAALGHGLDKKLMEGFQRTPGADPQAVLNSAVKAVINENKVELPKQPEHQRSRTRANARGGR